MFSLILAPLWDAGGAVLLLLFGIALLVIVIVSIHPLFRDCATPVGHPGYACPQRPASSPLACNGIRAGFWISYCPGGCPLLGRIASGFASSTNNLDDEYLRRPDFVVGHNSKKNAPGLFIGQYLMNIMVR